MRQAQVLVTPCCTRKASKIRSCFSGLLLALHRGGHIELPAARYDGFAASRRREPETIAIDTTLIESSLTALGPVVLRQVRRTCEEALVNALIAQHHYLGYRQPVGEHLRYVVCARERPIGCFLWSSAPRHLAPRDTFIGLLAPVASSSGNN